MSTIDLPFGAQVEELPDVFHVEGQIGTITLHRPLALSRFLEQYKNKPNFEAFSRAISDEVQALENAIIEAIVSRHVLYAEHAQLDLLGSIVGERRDGKADSVYRKFILTRVLINRSYGRPRDIISVLRAVDDAVFSFDEIGTAYFRIEYAEPPSTAGVSSAVPDLIRETRAAGIGASVVIPTSAHPFTLKNEGAVDVPELGLDDEGAHTGGTLSHEMGA